MFSLQDNFYAPIAKRMTTKVTLNDGKTEPYGYGLQINKFKGYDLIEHSGELAADKAYYARLPELKLSIIFFSNRANLQPWNIASNILNRIFSLYNIQVKENNTTSNEQTQKNSNPGILRSYQGVYGTDYGQGWEITLTNDTLKIGNRLVLVPINDSAFYLKINPQLHFTFSTNAAGLKMLTVTRFQDILDVGIYKALKKHVPVAAEYAGTYFSPELQLSYNIEKKGNTISLKKSPSESLELTPTYKDAFQNEPAFIRFTRKAGKVNGFVLSTYQTKNLLFVKK